MLPRGSDSLQVTSGQGWKDKDVRTVVTLLITNSPQNKWRLIVFRMFNILHISIVTSHHMPVKWAIISISQLRKPLQGGQVSAGGQALGSQPDVSGLVDPTLFPFWDSLQRKQILNRGPKRGFLMILHNKQGLGSSYGFSFPAFIRRSLPAFFRQATIWEDVSFPWAQGSNR